MTERAIAVSQSSSIVVVGAHPDDAVRACGGVMLRALSRGARVTVVAVTDGAALFGKDGIPDGPRTARARKAEQVRALKTLGVSRDDVVFLGFPDGGIAKLRHRHRTERSAAYFCPWLHADRTGDTSRVHGTEFTGSSLLHALAARVVISQPTHLFTHADVDKHPDHRGVTWFVKWAITELLNMGLLVRSPAVYEYLTYLRGMAWPPPGRSVPVAAARRLGFPGRVVNVRLSPAEVERKDTALDCFLPILGADYVANWRRTNEVYWVA